MNARTDPAASRFPLPSWRASASRAADRASSARPAARRTSARSFARVRLEIGGLRLREHLDGFPGQGDRLLVSPPADRAKAWAERPVTWEARSSSAAVSRASRANTSASSVRPSWHRARARFPAPVEACPVSPCSISISVVTRAPRVPRARFAGPLLQRALATEGSRLSQNPSSDSVWRSRPRCPRAGAPLRCRRASRGVRRGARPRDAPPRGPPRGARPEPHRGARIASRGGVEPKHRWPARSIPTAYWSRPASPARRACSTARRSPSAASS